MWEWWREDWRFYAALALIVLAILLLFAGAKHARAQEYDSRPILQLTIGTPPGNRDIIYRRREPNEEACWADAREFGRAEVPDAVEGATGLAAGCFFPRRPVTPIHDQARPDLDIWYRNLFSQHGPCCDGTDAKHVADVDWDSTCADGKCHYRVFLYDRWWDVSDDAVVFGPNLSGSPLVWPVPTRGLDGAVVSVFIRCFMPGAGG